MSMKRKVMGLMVASVMVTTAVAGSVNAAAPLKKAIVKPVVAVTKVAANVNGADVLVRSIKVKQTVLVSVKDFADAVGADLSYNKGVIELFRVDALVSLKVGSTKLTGSQGEATFEVAPTSVGGSVYVQWEQIAEGLNLDVEDNKISTLRLLSGTNSLPRWISEDQIVVSHENEDGTSTDYKINLMTKENSMISIQESSPGVISPDGKLAVYTTPTNEVFVIDLTTRVAKRVSADTEVKDEFSWSADGSKVYFLHGDKGQVIASLVIASGAITKLVDDKTYKSDLQVSADGNKFVYLVIKESKVTADSKLDQFDDKAIDVDNSTATIQLNYIDITKKDTKGVLVPATELTSTKDNKMFTALLSDGRTLYVSADVEGDNTKATLKLVDLDKKVTNLAETVDVLYSAVRENGQLVVVGTDNKVYAVNTTTGAATAIYTSAVDITGITFSKSGQISLSVSTDAGEGIVIVSNGKAVNITK